MERKGLVITRRTLLLLRLVEVYFAEEPETRALSGDLVVFLQARSGGKRCMPFHTLQLDLRVDPSRLWSEFGKTTRYEIRRAELRDGFMARILRHPSARDIEAFARFYNRFALDTGIARSNTAKLHALNRSSALMISRVSDSSEETMSCHAYIVTPERARLLYSATSLRTSTGSDQKAAIARANRMLHWHDIQAVHGQGITIYDFGGLALNGDPRLQGIDNFKRGFGGRAVLEYNCYVARSVLGRLALAYLERRRSP